MSRTLNLVACLLATGRQLQSAGRNAQALDIFRRMARFRHLSPDVAEEVHSRLSELYAGQERYKKARRHLTVALTYRPQRAAYHHRMARFTEADPDAAIDRAGRHHRRAVCCDPDNGGYWADYGAYLLGAGRTRPGRKALYRAARLAGRDADLVGRIAAAMREVGLWTDARRVLRAAQFENARDRRFVALWQRHQFERLCQMQQANVEFPSAQAEGRPMLLPFLRTAGEPTSLQVEGKIIRFDTGVGDDGATLPLPRRRPDSPRNRRTN
jgi:tetratricopeptide (TPR) repeat protein